MLPSDSLAAGRVQATGRLGHAPPDDKDLRIGHAVLSVPAEEQARRTGAGAAVLCRLRPHAVSGTRSVELESTDDAASHSQGNSHSAASSNRVKGQLPSQQSELVPAIAPAEGRRVGDSRLGLTLQLGTFRHYQRVPFPRSAYPSSPRGSEKSAPRRPI